MWKVDHKKTQSHWLEASCFEDGIDYHEYRAEVKWDGCIHFYRNHPLGEPPSEDYIHLCGGLDEFIQKLTQLNQLAKQHFGEGWPNQHEKQSTTNEHKRLDGWTLSNPVVVE